MNMDAAYRLIMSFDTTFIYLKSPFSHQKMFPNKVLLHLKYRYRIYALKLNEKDCVDSCKKCNFHQLYHKYFKALNSFPQKIILEWKPGYCYQKREFMFIEKLETSVLIMSGL